MSHTVSVNKNGTSQKQQLRVVHIWIFLFFFVPSQMEYNTIIFIIWIQMYHLIWYLIVIKYLMQRINKGITGTSSILTVSNLTWPWEVCSMWCWTKKLGNSFHFSMDYDSNILILNSENMLSLWRQFNILMIWIFIAKTVIWFVGRFFNFFAI